MLLYPLVACPFFYPIDKIEDRGYDVAPRLPLIDAYSGECRASGEAITNFNLCCNAGYARGLCPDFPEGAEWDAVRFHMAGREAGLVRVLYVYEKGCWPGLRGTLEYSISEGRFAGSVDDPVLAKLARAFTESYLRRQNHG